MSVTIKEKDLGWRDLQDAIGKAADKEVAVGIMKGGEELKKAMANEFGTDRIPERPFMRQTFDKVIDEIQKMKSEAIRQIIFDDVKPGRALSKIGVFYRQQVRAAIRNREFEPNADSTLERKLGKISDKKKQERIRKHIAKVGKAAATRGPIPLIDTGKMVQSIQVEVRNAKRMKRKPKG